MEPFEALVDQLAVDVTFNSPVTAYQGRDDVVHLLTIVSGVIDDYTVERELSGQNEAVSFISGRIADHSATGVIDRRFNDRGEITELTLMLRPLKALLAGVELMAQALAVSPLPSAR
jgi:hypothetical protein